MSRDKIVKVTSNPGSSHGDGQTMVSYSQNGRFILTSGGDGRVERFKADDNEDSNLQQEPEIAKVIDNNHENPILALAVSSQHFVTGGSDGSVNLYSLVTNSFERILVRRTLPVYDVNFSPDGNWVAEAGEESSVRLINVYNTAQMISLEDHRRGVKHVNFSNNGQMVSTSGADGILRIFTISTQQQDAQQTSSVLETIPKLELQDEATSKCCWHPDGQSVAVPNRIREILVLSTKDWLPQARFTLDDDSTSGPITDFNWSPNASYMAAVYASGIVNIWSCRSQTTVYNSGRLSEMKLDRVCWHPTQNTLAFCSNDGNVFKIHQPVPEPLPFGNPIEPSPRSRINSGGNGDESLFGDDDDDNWIIDDLDGQYTKKRPRDENDDVRREEEEDYHGRRRPPPQQQVSVHQPFQPGSTEWENRRRYLAINFIGHIWTLDQDEYNTISVSFVDRSKNRDYHFTDRFKYDIGCLSEKGVLFGSTKSQRLFCRSHQSAGDSWSVELPRTEKLRVIGLSNIAAVACSDIGYTRIYDCEGNAIRIIRHAANPVICCKLYKDILFMIRHQPRSDILVYSIEKVLKNSKIYQRDEIVEIKQGSYIKQVLFSESGDPYIYDSDGILSVLVHWRKPLQGQWIPLLDTCKNMPGRQEREKETYWPIGISGKNCKFHCIILKGRKRLNYCPFPLPLFSEFDIKIPIFEYTSKEGVEQEDLEEQFIRNKVQLELIEDASSDDDDIISRKQLDLDKVLLQLFNGACRQSKIKKALSLATMITQPQALEASNKIALRFELTQLAERINLVIEERAKKI